MKGFEDMTPEQCKALIVEDNPVDAQFFKQMLSMPAAGRDEGLVFEVERSEDLASALDRIGERAFDVVLLDLTLPDSEGLDTFVRLHSEALNVPIVVLTGDDDQDLAIEAVQKGAQDYIVKRTVDSQVLGRSLRYAIERHRLLQAVKRYARDAEAKEERIRRAMERLEVGFARLARGDTSVRIAQEDARPGGDDLLVNVLRRFDETVQKLEKATELNAEFYSMATHDMRSPLSTIRLSIVSLRQEASLSPRGRDLIDMMGRATDRMLRLVNSLLEIFTIDSGLLRIEPTELDLSKLLQECAGDLRVVAAERGQQLVVEPIVGDATVFWDREKTAEVLENLIGNAIKYSTRDDEVIIRASAGANGLVRVDVLDHGPGIPEEDLTRVFERFHRSAHTSASTHGSGLGLSICKQYIGAQGGEIWVNSEPGKGSCFSFQLPRQVHVKAPENPGHSTHFPLRA